MTAEKAPDEATSIILKQLEKAPENSDLYLLLGNTQRLDNDHEQALISYRSALAKNPDNEQASIALGKALVELGRKNEALKAFEDMVARNLAPITGLLGIGMLHMTDGDFSGAMEKYREVLSLQDNHPIAANNLAWIITKIPDGDMGEALRLALLAKQASPNDASIADTLGWVYYKRGTNSLAIAQFEAALESRPGDPTISFHLALALHAEGRDKEAGKILEAVLETGENFTEKEEAEALLKELGR